MDLPVQNTAVIPEGTFSEPKSTGPSKLPLIILTILTFLFASTSVYFFTKLKQVSLSTPSVTLSIPSPTPTTSPDLSTYMQESDRSN